MTLITEDGSGLADAESLCSVEYADTYHAARGTTTWAGLSTAEKEQALRRGTDYLEQHYGVRLAGHRQFTVQALAFPRYELPRKGGFKGEYWATGAVPLAAAQACAEMALRAGKADLAPDIGRLKKSITVGPIKTEYVDSDGVTRYRQIDQIMSQFMAGSSSSIALARS
ncbi:MAG: hypothetical protein K2X80_07265 [Pseudomonadaceae bacterium]|nr:hypothetical protein [Pseudomonadaceae bacterium]